MRRFAGFSLFLGARRSAVLGSCSAGGWVARCRRRASTTSGHRPNDVALFVAYTAP